MTEIYLSLLYSLGFGILGSILRFIVDFNKRDLKFKVTSRGLLFYIFLIIVTGGFAGIIVDYGWIGSVLGGYAALDLMEGFYKYTKNTNIKVVRNK